MTRDDFPFRNRYSPQSHRLCRDPLCLTCLMAERDNYELVRYYPRTETRLFLLKHCRGKLRTIDGTEEKSA